MPNWKQVLDELNRSGSTFDIVRRSYLRRFANRTKRNVIIYYSGWLQKPGIPNIEINDQDKIGFMTTVHQLDKAKGLDLVLHTPGGDVAATESIGEYLREIFGIDIRIFVPQLAMSGGTMLSCIGKEIHMGKQSSLGPIDPQHRGLPVYGVIEEFEQAHKEIKADQSKMYVWQPIIAKYTPALIGECAKALKWADQLARKWLLSGMFANDQDGPARVDEIVRGLTDHAGTKSHNRHLSATSCSEIGFGDKIKKLEDDHLLQDMLLSIHHACMLTFQRTDAVKIIENQKGIAYINQQRMIRIEGIS